MGVSPYPAHRVRVDYSQPLPGAPRERRVKPITAMRRPDRLRDDMRPVAVNPLQTTPKARTRPDASGHGRYTVAPLPPMPPIGGRAVAPVTGRKAQRRPGWSSVVAGPSHV